MRIRASAFILGAIFFYLICFAAPRPVLAQSSLTSTVSGVEIPESVLYDVQMQYQGYAVTSAGRGYLNGQPVYSLRMTRSNISTDSDNKALIFDMQWNFLANGQVQPAPSSVKNNSSSIGPSTQSTRQTQSGSGNQNSRDRKVRKNRGGN